jgi:very-short-patch-repair endonuclease
MPDSLLAARLEAARQELLDLGLRNPLLNYRPSKAQGVGVVAEESGAVYELLVQQGRTMYFRPAAEGEAPALSEAEQQAAHSDNKLQTAEPAAKLESRLQNTFYTARTSLEETGANILYLALGLLTWYEPGNSTEPRRAPLLLVPVLLERGTATERFRLRYTGAEVEENLSLQARLLADFNLSLPAWDEEQPLEAYYAAVAAVSSHPQWQVAPNDIVLGFFSFGKFLLYRDLAPANWPADRPLLAHPAIAALLSPEAGFRDAPPTVGEDAFLDTESPANELHQVLDADSSQLLALLAVQEGRNLVIQGPPGTGKSQTIANLLAEAIGAGKKVLFVAEKMAALDVVKRRLDVLGLGAACLELHSHKTSKKALLDELKATLELGRPAAVGADAVGQLPTYRQLLNDYARAANAPLGRSRRTAQQVAGELLLLQAEPGAAGLPRPAFANLPEWTDADAARAEALAARLQATLQKIGPPKSLLFWGSELTVWLPADQAALLPLLQAATAAVQEMQSTAQALAQALGLPAPEARAATEALLPAARHAQLAPALTGFRLTDPRWTRQAAQLTELLQAGEAYASLHQQHDNTVLPEAWAHEFLAERAALLEYGRKWWKFLVGDYRRARRRLQHFWRGPLPDEAAELLPVIDALHEGRRHAQVLSAAEETASQLFGPHWRGPRSDWPQLRRVADYLLLTHQRMARAELPTEFLEYLARPLPPATITAPLAALELALARHRQAVQAVADALQLNEARRFGPEGRLQFQDFATQQATLLAWAANLLALGLTVEWNNAAATARAEQLPELLVLAESWPAAAQSLAAATRQAWLEFLQKLAYEQYPALRQFERAAHEEVISRFQEADRDSLYHNRIRAMQRHFEGLPALLAGGQMLVLKNEFAKKARHKPLRRLLAEAGRAVQAIKPVLMMSPLSVASFLPPGALEFDLVVFDEASQVKPVDALGAIARGRQLVVVGDSRQLPPSSFFDSLTAAEEATDEHPTVDIPSILELCKARQMPERLLRWHYRSRHESLIAPSNHLFYNDQLIVFPSPGGQGELGLKYHHLPEAYYERGSTRTNPAEAAAVAEAVLQHARHSPQHSLGVVAFSTAQRQAIEDALGRLRRQQPDSESFFNQHPAEPFFIKNLENVQGDERDVMFISLGYGRTREGQLTMNFGPLNGEGGERRLNVLISRAKLRCEVFTNLTADDLDLSRTAARGVAALQAFLRYAQRGVLGESQTIAQAPGSPFEEAMYQLLTARGYSVHRQVGSPGFSLDLAVADPAQPGRYVLGIEGDGTMYSRARSARDRDRLRQEVLTGMGWRLHRSWSTDWLRDPARATERAVQAIEAARQVAALPAESEKPAISAPELSRENPSAAGLSTPYQLAQLPPAIGQKEVHRHPVGRLAAWVAEVVAVESPVHNEEVTRRLALAAGATQLGARIRSTVAAAIALAARIGSIRQEADFLWTPTMAAGAAPVRDRSALPPASRKPGLIAPEELAAAVLTVMRSSFMLEPTAVVLPAARLLGFARPGEELRPMLISAVDALVASGQLALANGLLTLP